MTVFSFDSQLEKGTLGETQFVLDYPQFSKNPCITGCDFIDKELGYKVELKTDYHPIESTPNFFIERYSSIEAKSDGGPWQAFNKGALWYVYRFNNHNTYYWILLSKLSIYLLEKITKNSKLKIIANERYSTAGYLVKREELLLKMPNCYKDEK